MRAEIICVGTELLLGDIANTNAQEIGALLATIGVDCQVHTVVGDNEERIARAISDALDRADAVVITGGLGPTQDDVTREAIARATSQELIRDPALEDRQRAIFARMNRPMAQINLRQADRPLHSIVIEQRIGTAPGLIVEHSGRAIYAIPGVPAEMREMMERAVLPDLAKRSGEASATVSRVVRTAGMSESAIAEKLAPLWSSLEGGGVTLAYLAGGGEVRIRLTAKAPSENDAEQLLEPVAHEVSDLLGAFVISDAGQTLEESLGALLRDRKLSIAFGESVTAGLAAARMTRVAGSSEYVKGSIVAYTAESKTALLGVDPIVIKESGIVSEDVARAMAQGARERFEASIGVGLTGAAGPADHGGKPRGTVCIGIDGPHGVVSRELRLPGERETVRTMAATIALNITRLYLLDALHG
ncbi:MAG: competence/damage-inducible protein A [Actinomycetota bacterium]